MEIKGEILLSTGKTVEFAISGTSLLGAKVSFAHDCKSLDSRLSPEEIQEAEDAVAYLVSSKTGMDGQLVGRGPVTLTPYPGANN